jgi:hypothetical protein
MAAILSVKYIFCRTQLNQYSKCDKSQIWVLAAGSTKQKTPRMRGIKGVIFSKWSQFRGSSINWAKYHGLGKRLRPDHRMVSKAGTAGCLSQFLHYFVIGSFLYVIFSTVYNYYTMDFNKFNRFCTINRAMAE